MSALKAWTRPEDGVKGIGGIYLFLLPWIWSATDSNTASWNSFIFGVVIVLLALWALASARTEGVEYLDAIVGIWVIISPWVLGFTEETGVAVSSWVVGAVVLVLSLLAQQRVHRAGASSGTGGRVSAT